jgi:Rad3-related DNA helicase
MGIDLQNKIVLIDEAHNIASTAQSAYDISITNFQLSQALDGLEEL